jgi:GTP pyrophosphokinase
MSSETLAKVMKETNHAKKEEFFVALGNGALSPQHVVTRVIHLLSAESEAATATLPNVEEPGKEPAGGLSSTELGVQIGGVGDVAVRIPQCCRPVPGDEVVGYISLGRGITIHRRDCPNIRALEKNPERLVTVTWDSRGNMPLRVEIQIEAYDRSHLLEDISRTLSESGVNIVGAQVTTAKDNMVRDRFVFEVPSIDYLETVLQRLRRIDTVYDAYRVTPN